MGNGINRKSLKCGPAIQLLSITALICRVLGSVSYFFGINYKVYELEFEFPPFPSFMEMLFGLVPYVIFILYIFKYRNKLRANILVPIVFGSMAFSYSYSMLLTYIENRNYYQRHDLEDALFDFLGEHIISLLLLISSVLMLIGSLKGFKNKVFTIISMVSFLYPGIWYIFYTYYNLLDGFNWESISEATVDLSRNILKIAFLVFWITLFLFALTNRIPPVISGAKPQNSLGTMSPEQELRILKNKFDCGIITEEEYRAQRAEIIVKL